MCVCGLYVKELLIMVFLMCNCTCGLPGFFLDCPTSTHPILIENMKKTYEILILLLKTLLRKMDCQSF